MAGDYLNLIPTAEGARLIGLWSGWQVRPDGVYVCNARRNRATQMANAVRFGIPRPFGTVDQRGVVRAESDLYIKVAKPIDANGILFCGQDNPVEPLVQHLRVYPTLAFDPLLAARGVPHPESGEMLPSYEYGAEGSPIKPTDIVLTVEPTTGAPTVTLSVTWPTPDGIGLTVDVAQSDVGQGRMHGSYDDDTTPARRNRARNRIGGDR